MKTEMWTWMRVQFFRFWTAWSCSELTGIFGSTRPSTSLGGRERSTPLIEKGCDMLSYPGNDAGIPYPNFLIEPPMGFGLSEKHDGQRRTIKNGASWTFSER
jgi:hypothetical protein